MPGFQIRIDASQAKKGAAEFSEAASKIAKDAKKASTEVDKILAPKATKSLKKQASELESISKAIRSLESAAHKASGDVSVFSNATLSLAKGAAAVYTIKQIADAAIALSMALVAAGSKAEETTNKFNVVFAGVNEQAALSAQNIAKNYGMATEAAQASLSQIGDLLSGLGVAKGEALALAESATKLGVDLASFTNYSGGAQGAVNALTSAMLGEAEAAKSLGLVLQDQQMERYAQGVGKTWKNLDIAEKAQLRLNAAIAQSPNAVGDFERSMASYANQSRVASAISEDFMNIVGSGVIPAASMSLSMFNKNRISIEELANVIGGFLNEELLGIVDSFNDVSGSSSAASIDNMGLSSSFVSVAGGAKAAWNAISILVDAVIAGATSVSVGAKTIGLSAESLYAAVTFDKERFDRAGEEMRLIGTQWVSDTKKAFSVDWEDLEKGLDLLHNPEGFVKKYIEAMEKMRKEAAKSAASGAKGIAAPLPKISEKDAKGLKSAASSVKSLNAEIARLTLSGAELEKWKVDEKISELEKTLGKANPEVARLRTLLTKEVDSKIFDDLLKQADPVAAEIANIKKEHEKFVASAKALQRIDPARYESLMTKEAKEHAKALANVNTAEKEHLDFQRETQRIAAQNSGNNAEAMQLEYQSKVDQWEKEGQSREDIAARVNAEMLKNDEQFSFDSQKLWEESTKRIDESMVDMLMNMGKKGENVFEGMANSFKRMLAEMANAALLRPITVSIMGTVGGVLGMGGTSMAYNQATGQIMSAAAGAGGTGGGMNLGGLPVGSMIPESWTSGASGLFGGVTSGINNFGNTLLPSVFAGNFANPAEAALASFSGAPTLFGTLGAAGAGFGLGGLAGKLLFPDKPNISMGSGLGGGLGAAVGTLFGGGIGTLIGGGIGSLFGGGIGSLFGSKKPKKPAVWGGMNLNLGDADAYDNYDFTSTYDRKGYGKSDFEVTEADYYTIASRDRNKAGGETSKAMQDVLKSVADSAIAQAQAVQKALPEEYAKQFKAQLSQHEIVADVGLKGDDISKEGFEKVASDIQEHVNDSLLKSFQGMDFAEYSGKIKIDQSTIEGLGQFTKALTSIDTAVSSTEQLKNPLSDVEQQAKAAVEQMKSWEDSMHSLGVESEYAATLMDDYRVATVDKFMKSIQDTVNPMSQLEQQAKAQVDQINGWVAALKIMSATEAQVAEAEHARVVAQENLLQTFRDATSPMSDLEKQTRTAVDAITQTVAAMRILGNAESDIAEVEAHRVVVQNNLLDAAHRLVTVTPEIVTATDSVNAEFDAFVAAMKIAGGSLSDLARLEADRISAIQAAVDTLHVPFYDNLTVRTETVLGNDTSTLQLEIAQKKELEEAIKTFGKDSAEYLALVSVQNAESVKHQSDLAKQAADEATRAYENAQASAKSFAQAVEQASNALHQADTNVANAKNALLRYFSDAVTSAENAVKAAKDAQEQLRLSLVQALVGAVDAAKSSTQSAVDAWASEAQSAFEQAQSAYANALGEEASGIKNLVDKHKSLAESMRNLRKDMFLDAQTNPAGGMGAYKSAQSEMQSLFALAKGGDVDAAIRFQDISQKFLDASLSTSSSSSEYQEDFYSVNAMLAELEASSQVQSDAQQAQLDALNAQLESMEEQKKTTEQLRIEMEAARLQAERADKEQISFYEKWDLGKIVPGLEGLENEYRTQAEILREADTALNQALLDGLTTQAELDSLKVVDAVAKLSEDYKAAQENLVAQEEKLATALQEKLDAESKWGVLEVKTQLQLLQDALSTAIGEQTTALNAVLAAQEAAARAAEEAARAQAEAARQQAAANAQAEAARKAAEEAAKKKAEADAKYGGKSQAQIIAEKTSGLNSGLYQGQEKAPGGGSWTSSSTLTKMMQDYGSFDEWYRQIGKAEGYATGGLAKPGRMKFFGEQGLEVGDVASPTRIYDAEKTRLMLDNGYDYAKQAHDSVQALMRMPAVGTDGSRSAVISELREQNAQLKTQNKLLQSLLNESQSARKNTQGIADSVENMVRGGVRVRQ